MNAGTIRTARYRVDATMTAQPIRLPQSGRVQRMRRTDCKREGWWARGVCGRGVLSNVITPLPVADAGAVGVWRCGDGCKAGESGPRKCPWQTPLLWRWHKCGRRVRCARGVRGLASTPPARRCRRRGTIRGRRSSPSSSFSPWKSSSALSKVLPWSRAWSSRSAAWRAAKIRVEVPEYSGVFALFCLVFQTRTPNLFARLGFEGRCFICQDN